MGSSGDSAVIEGASRHRVRGEQRADVVGMAGDRRTAADNAIDCETTSPSSRCQRNTRIDLPPGESQHGCASGIAGTSAVTGDQRRRQPAARPARA